ncbi:MAG: polyprenol monophosphomannose synthase [Lachnospiraceae bacterium]|nr:polyprenol monophosphomannose synthase [Lachnospiraceae bacterium]
MRKLSIVVPSFNEKDNIVPLVDRIDKALGSIPHEIIFVDDSNDETPDVIAGLAKEKHYVRLKHRENKKGLATAVLLGFKLAEGDYLVCMDADLQHPPELLLPMYVAMETGADICIPSRLIEGGSDGGLNWYRKLISGTARLMGQVLLPCLRSISDPTGGLFIVKRSVASEADMRPVGWKIMVELLATARYSRIIEIPYEFKERVAGESKIDISATLQYIEQCIGLRRRMVRNKNVVVKRWTCFKLGKMVDRYMKSKGISR